MTDLVGWMSAVVLAATLSRQVYTQWRTGKADGVSHWLFIGQMAASAGFIVYSLMLKNWVFVVTNFFNFFAATVGQCIYKRNQRLSQSKKDRQ
ncbi:MAG: hypothetical protein HYS18_05550 [Burkholderiales bacterium]|nr:hypothetical protein [Burkholderiales bacterium]